MVCLSVPRLGYVPKLCLARPMLFAALECFDRGDLIGAGVRLREAVDRFVRAACDWYGVKVEAKFLTPKAFAKALRKAGHLDKWGYTILIEAVEAGNKLAHCQSVEANTIRGGITVVFALMDGEPYCGHDRQPIVTSRKTEADAPDDDDDNADWWKAGVK
jgi:hypothetical protein